MDAKLRNGLLITGGLIAAVAGGWQIAQESIVLPGLVAAAMIALLAGYITGRRIDVLASGILIIGYLVGNRGFAQLSVPNLPLLVGELTLGLSTLVVLWDSARSQTLPFRRDSLNCVLVAWLVFGAVRLWFDLQRHGAVALRDFALLYYACFFFFAQAWGRDRVLRSWIERCLDIGFLAAPPVFIVFLYWPELFSTTLAIRGVPVIYMKSDVEGGLLVAGVFWMLRRYLETKHSWWLAPASLNLIGVVLSNSRAAHVAIVITALWPLLCRDWRLIRPLCGLSAAGILALVTVSATSAQPWSKTPLYRVYESMATIVDVEGAGAYVSEDLGDKPDNNRFRLTWWRAVIEETWQESPWLGLGFGHNLAEQFVRLYYAESREEFSARSPHNFILTVFGRLGLCGLALFTLVLAALVARTIGLCREAATTDTHRAQLAAALGALAILSSACFGVVLEGPMAATLFWTMLGLANTPNPRDPETAPIEAAPAREIPHAAKRNLSPHELAPASLRRHPVSLCARPSL